VVVVLIAAILAFSVVTYVAAFLRNRPPTVSAQTDGGTTSLTLQTVGTVGFGSNPDWVSYLVQEPGGSWEQSTIFELPAHSIIHVTVYQFDSQTGLRNPFFGNVQGVDGGMITVDGQQVSVIDPSTAAHTFAIPDLGVAVPLQGISNDATNPCPAAPCTQDFDHVTIEFTFETGAPGTYRWQCFVPCGAGTLFGNGGPMQTVGYMDGFVHVV
jgi:hypothetical protein